MPKILLDPGHSRIKQGALSRFAGLNEYDLNTIQALACQDFLRKFEIDSEIIDPAQDNLTAIGKQAANFDCFISLHLNSCEDPQVNYTAVCLEERLKKPASKALATRIALNFTQRFRIRAYNGAFGPGLMYLPSAVLKAAENACKGPCVLTEAFFVSCADYKSKDELILKANQAGRIIALSIAEHLLPSVKR